MPNRDDIMIDHDEIAEHTLKLQAMLDELDDVIEGFPRIIEVLKAEASTGTSSGAPAPIFIPVIEASGIAFGNVAKSLAAIREKIVNDIEVLRAASRDTLANEGIAVQSIDSVDTSLTSASKSAHYYGGQPIGENNGPTITNEAKPAKFTFGPNGEFVDLSDDGADIEDAKHDMAQGAANRAALDEEVARLRDS